MKKFYFRDYHRSNDIHNTVPNRTHEQNLLF